jgi:hypothetical protein
VENAKLALGAQNKGMGRIGQAQKRPSTLRDAGRGRFFIGVGVFFSRGAANFLPRGVDSWAEIWYNICREGDILVYRRRGASRRSDGQPSKS